MKIKHCLFHAGLAALFAVLFTSCFSPWQGAGEAGEALTIYLPGSGTSRSLVTSIEQNTLAYEITLSGPGPSITGHFSGGTTATFRVQPGTWNVEVKGRGGIPSSGTYTTFTAPMLRAFGEKTITVNAGSASAASIEMYPAFEAANYAQLHEAVVQARGGGKEYVFVTNDITTTGLISVGEITPDQNIELRAERPVTIQRDTTLTSVSIFRVQPGGTLTLGKANGNDMHLALYGGGDDFGSTSSLIVVGGNLVLNDARIYQNTYGGTLGGGGVRVESGGTFTMYGGSIDGNKATGAAMYGGQVYVAPGASFEMYNGTISGGGTGNHANYGGGVFIENYHGNSGRFIKTGGTIYGSESGLNTNLLAGSGGSAVCFYGGYTDYFYCDATLGPNDPLSTEDLGINWEEG